MVRAQLLPPAESNHVSSCDRFVCLFLRPSIKDLGQILGDLPPEARGIAEEWENVTGP